MTLLFFGMFVPVVGVLLLIGYVVLRLCERVEALEKAPIEEVNALHQSLARARQELSLRGITRMGQPS